MRGQPTLYKYPDGRSPFWQIKYYDGKRTRCVSTGCRIGAQDNEAQLALSCFIIERSKPVNRRPEEMLVAQALEDYWQEHAQFQKTAADTRRILDHLKTRLQADYVSQIRPAVQAEYCRTRAAMKKAAGTIRNEMAILKAALNHAMRNERLTSVPFIKLPSAAKPRQRVITPQEAIALLDACQTLHVYAFILLALNTGQRKSAIENLKWFQVDFDRNLIDFRQPGETSKTSGVVTMNGMVRDMMLDMSQHRTCEHVLEYKGKSAGNTKKALARTVSNAGLCDISAHTLRHSAASWMAGADVPMGQIAQILGHSNPNTTQKNYVKFTPEFTRSGTESVEKVLNIARGAGSYD